MLLCLLVEVNQFILNTHKAGYFDINNLMNHFTLKSLKFQLREPTILLLD